MENFITINQNIECEITVKKSKFICNLIKVESQNEAEEQIKIIRKKYHDARHNCIAYRIKENEIIVEKASDDGEPSGTAGGPMLNILQKNNLCNVLVIVTRYFGGILLGTGGLVRAYSDATFLAINSVNKTEMCTGLEYETKLDYNNFETFKYFCRKNEINIVNTHYTDIIICKIQLEESKKAILLQAFENKNVNLIDLRFLSKKIINKCIIK